MSALAELDEMVAWLRDLLDCLEQGDVTVAEADAAIRAKYPPRGPEGDPE